MTSKLNGATRTASSLVIVLYVIELLDEFIYGLHSAALPFIKADLNLTYTQVGLLFTVPGLVAIFAEPIIGLLGDTKHRRALMLGGLAATSLSLFLVSIGNDYLIILFAFVIMASASGAYVNLSQATLVDRDTTRSEQTMARWTLLGAIGVTASPLIAATVFYLGYGWRGLYLSLVAVAGFYTAALLRHHFNGHHVSGEESVFPKTLLANLLKGLTNGNLIRWMLLMELADFMLDKLLEVTGLYFHDVVGVSLAGASVAVAVASISWLVGGAVLVPVLEKMKGLRVLRFSALIAAIAYASFLVVPSVPIKYVLIAIVFFCTSAWYPILKAKCYETFPGQSGLVMAVTSIGNISSLFVPALVGMIADAVGLSWAMWVLIIGPLALLIALPHSSRN